MAQVIRKAKPQIQPGKILQRLPPMQILLVIQVMADSHVMWVTSKVHNVLPDSNSILEELSQLRAVRTNPPMNMFGGTTDVKIFRVACWGTQGHVAAEFNRVGYTTGMDKTPPTVSHSVSLYPTLVQQSYTVSFTLPQSGMTTFTVFDVVGRVVSEKQIGESQGSHTEVFYASGLRAGTYYMQFHSGNIVETKKFVVLQ